MNIAEATLRGVDRFQQGNPVLGFPVAVVKKFGDDRAGAFATRIVYHGHQDSAVAPVPNTPTNPAPTNPAATTRATPERADGCPTHSHTAEI